MKRFALASLLLLSVFASPAAAATATETQAEDDRPSDCGQLITDGVYLCSSSYDQQTNTSTVELYVDSAQAVTLVDGLGWQNENRNEIPRKTGIVLEPGRTEITLESTMWKNKVILMLDTGESLAPIRIEDGKSPGLGVLPGSPQTSDPIVAGATVFGLFALGFPISVLLVRRSKGLIERDF